MRALILNDFHQMSVTTIADAPPPEAGEARIRIFYTGICGSDIHGFTGENGRRHPGQIMGHESSGAIESLGEGSAETGLAVGDIVTFNPLVTCEACPACLEDLPQHCPDRLVIGVTQDIVAGFAELLTVPVQNVEPLGDVDPRFGALVEPLAVALHACDRARLAPGSIVLVNGGGPIGQSSILAALRKGAAKVFAAELSAERRELCESLGAVAIDPTVAPLDEQIHRLYPHGVDVTIDAVGIEATLASSLKSTKFGGTILLLGMGAPNVSIPAFAVSTEERSIIGSFCYSRKAFHDAARWVAEGDPVFDTLITKSVALEEGGDAFTTLATSTSIPGKILVRVSER